MFFIAHAYYSQKVSDGTATPLRIVGSLLADSALTGAIGWTDLHDNRTIQAFTKSLPKNHAELGAGLRDHYELDSRSHNDYEGGEGYAFSHQTPELRELVAQACGLTPKRAQGLAHNFIEAGVDCNLLAGDTLLQKSMHEVLQAVNMDLVAKHLSNFFKTNAAETQSRLTAYKNLITNYDLQKIDDWVELWDEIIFRLLGNKADERATKKALMLATKLTSKDYQRVLNN